MVQSVERALRLLTAVAARPEGAGVRELARACGLKAPTAQALLKTLAAHEFLAFDPDSRRYRLGVAAARLAAGSPVEALRTFVRPAVSRLHAQFGETAAALAWLAGRAQVIDWRQSEHALAVTHPDQEVTQPHRLASGRVLLAFQPPAVLAAYLAGLDAPTAGLARELQAIREARWAETENLGGSGIVAVAAPVCDGAGELVLALACSLSQIRCDEATRERMRVATRAEAEGLTARLAGMGDVDESA